MNGHAKRAIMTALRKEYNGLLLELVRLAGYDDIKTMTADAFDSRMTPPAFLKQELAGIDGAYKKLQSLETLSHCIITLLFEEG